MTAFFSAALALLLVPGPTNTLMGVAGANAILSHVVRLMSANKVGFSLLYFTPLFGDRSVVDI